ncbi:ABC-2 type transport system permease protein [Thermosipho japonicus]|uniref:ABC-2 type transport system permease protein n=1 Tax=Thermosipho japonicus TaxID=90323 RepID=A0A841GTI9_9BACT|nr:hypothetical protein [Thermosipho japonicus]MBB6062660.1 ABC-2 type transport system permease protein [Thermosipho japonicus]
MVYLNVFKGTVLRVISELKRYYLNTISFFTIMTMLFYFMVLGVTKFGNPANLGESIQALAIGYIVWFTFLGTITDLSWTIINEMSIGLIEQAFISPVGPSTIYLFYQFSNFLIMIPFEFLILIVVFKIAGIPLIIPMSFIIALILMMLQGYGIGLVLAGITLRFKRTQALLNIAQFAIIGLLLGDYKGIVKYIVPANGYMKILRNLIEGSSLRFSDWIYMITSSLLYIFIGVILFNYFADAVRKRGEISQY